MLNCRWMQPGVGGVNRPKVSIFGGEDVVPFHIKNPDLEEKKHEIPTVDGSPRSEMH